MQKRNLFALTAVGLAAAIAVPTIAFGNARTTNKVDQTPQTPLVSRMLGANEVPNNTPGSQTDDPDGFGSASVTFDLNSVPVACQANRREEFERMSLPLPGTTRGRLFASPSTAPVERPD